MKVITLLGCKEIGLHNMEEKSKLLLPEDKQEKIAKRNDNFLLNPFFRVQKESWTESLALLLSADSPSGPFIVLEICVLFC